MAQWWNDVKSRAQAGTAELAQQLTVNGHLDAIPLASQGKSIVQALAGDKEGAKKTQDNFSKRCVGVAQARASLERRRGDSMAAASTEAEFRRTMQEAEEAMRPTVLLAQERARETEQAMRPHIQKAEEAMRPHMEKAETHWKENMLPHVEAHVNRAEEAVQRGVTSLRSSDFAANVARRAEVGAAAAQRALSQSELGRKFGELLAQHQHRGDSCGASSSSRRGPISELDKYTILTEAAGPQCGVQCSCCLENLQEGESIRVLPCFHCLHDNCAQQWLLKQPICPVCRCDIVASLEAHHG